MRGKRGAGVGHAQDIDEKLGQLEHAAADADDPRVRIDVAEEHAAHGRAGGRGADDPAMRLENVAEVADHPAGLFPIARVEGRLAAAGLRGRIDHRHAVPGEQLDRGPADLRIELVDIAGEEQGHRLALGVGGIILARGDRAGGGPGLFRRDELDHGRLAGGRRAFSGRCATADILTEIRKK